MPDEDTTCRADFQLVADPFRELSALADLISGEAVAADFDPLAELNRLADLPDDDAPPAEANKAFPAVEGAGATDFRPEIREWQAKHPWLNIVPGQSDTVVEAIITAMMVELFLERPDAEWRYAGRLGASAPKPGDFQTLELHDEAYGTWRYACTPFQKKLLASASARRQERDRQNANAEARLAYAMAKAEEGKTVRGYSHHATDSERDEAQATQAAARMRAYRERKRLTETEAEAFTRRQKSAEARRRQRAAKGV